MNRKLEFQYQAKEKLVYHGYSIFALSGGDVPRIYWNSSLLFRPFNNQLIIPINRITRNIAGVRP